MSFSKQSFSVLQKIGQSLMIPVSVLPAAGLLVALGRVLLNASETGGAEVTNPLLHGIGQVFYSGGLAIFEQLPVVFAAGVAIGFTGGEGIAALASVVGYFTLVNVLKVIGEARGLPLKIDTGVFGGILMGLLSASLYKSYFQTKLHPVFGFFSGKRLIPIITAASAILVGVILAYVWPPIQNQINAFGLYVMSSDLGPAFYAAGKRLLIPVGLHHVYYPPFLYQFGEYVTAGGQVLKGETARYFAGDMTAGRFMASEFPIMLFGLPAAAFAMVLRARPEKRKAVAGVMLTAALTSIITGITEPIEFAFIFVAPILFVFHVVAAFCSGLLTGSLDIHLGYTFSASIIDYAVGFFNQKNSMYLFVSVGPLIAAIYFGVFYVAIGALNLKTPGREDEVESESSSGSATYSNKAEEVLAALGGKENIVHLDACITRLRLTAKDSALVNQARLKAIGAAGILNAGGGNFQIIFGVESDMLKEEIKGIMAGNSVKRATSPSVTKSSKITADRVMLFSPISGKIIPIGDVPDATFAQKILGDGVAVDPTDGVIYAPVDGKIAQVFRTNHAIGLETTDGLEILIHVGIDTVQLNGQGFKAFVKTGDAVVKGQKLLEFDLEYLKKMGKPTISPIVITNMDRVKGLRVTTEKSVKANDNLMSVDA